IAARPAEACMKDLLSSVVVAIVLCQSAGARAGEITLVAPGPDAAAIYRASGTQTGRAPAPAIGDPPEAANMRLVGVNDLQGRSAYQPTIHKQGDRWIAYIGHHGGTDAIPRPIDSLTGQPEFNGTSILDVTDPARPRYLFHIPGQPGRYESGGAQMTRVCDGSMLPRADRSAVYLLRT